MSDEARGRVSRTALPLAIAMLVAACAGPRPEPPAAARVEPPAGWRSQVEDPTHTLDAAWWRAYGDQILDELVATALARNTDIAVAYDRIRQADALVRINRSAQLPTIGGSGIGIPRERTFGPLGSPIEFSAYNAQAQLFWDLDLFGRLGSLTKAARAELLATRAFADATRLNVAAATCGAYIRLRAADAATAIVQRTIAVRGRELKLRQRQAATGLVQRATVDEAASEFHAAEAELPPLLIETRRAEDQLNVLLGENPVPIPRGLAVDAIALPGIPVAVPARVLRDRPDLLAAEQQIVAADHALDSRRAEFLPDITLSASIGRLGADLLTQPITTYSFIGSSLEPIFSGGRLEAQQDLAASQRDEAAFTYRKAAITAFSQVEDALAAASALAAQDQTLQYREVDTLGILRLAKRRFEEGQTDYFEVEDAERQVLGVQLSRVRVKSAQLTNSADLAVAVGGGWASADLTGERSYSSTR